MAIKLFSTFSLRLKATGITLAIVTFALVIMAAAGIFQIHRQIFIEQHRGANIVAQGVFNTVESVLAVRDWDQVDACLRRFADGSVTFISVVDQNGFERAKFVRDPLIWEAYKRGKLSSAQCVVGQSAQVGDIAGTEVGGEVGRVFVGISTQAATQAQMDQTRLTTFTAVAAGLIAGATMFLILGPWIRRLLKLSQVSHAIAMGDLSQKSDDRSEDEIGSLGQSFELMRTKLQQRDLELRQFTNTLQEQVKQRTQQLEIAVDNAQRANQAKSMFLANMSHELRTPLNGVIGMVTMLLETNPDARQKNYCEIAKSSGRALLDLINDILDFSKIEAGKLDLEEAEFDLTEMLESVVQMFAERAAVKKIELVCGFDNLSAMVCGDQVRLRQVLVNLMGNALKFTESGSVVLRAEIVNSSVADIEMLDDKHGTAATVRSHEIEFAVQDTGVGIPADRLDRLFKSFSQVDASTTRKFGGTGLGLAISQRIAELMGGQITVCSELGKGSEFKFRAKLKIVARNVNKDTEVFRDKRALVIDQNNVRRDLTVNMLRSFGMQAVSTTNVTEAALLFDAIESSDQEFDLVVYDASQQEPSSARWIRSINRHKKPAKTLGICSILHPAAEKDGWVDHFLAAPILPTKLRGQVLRLLSVQAGKPEAAKSEVYENQKLSGVKVLVAEDNEVNQFVVSEILGQLGCRVSLVANGLDALERVKGEAFDIVLMDCQMPVMDGFEATRQIRLHEQGGRKTPVVALTANATLGDREACLASGMDGYVSKPIDVAELVKAIRQFIPSCQINEKPDSKIGKVEPRAASPIVWEPLLKRCLGNEKLATKAIRKFGESVESELIKLATDLKANNIDQVAKTAHKLKGAAANISADRVMNIAADLEKMAKSSEGIETCEIMLQNLSDEVQVLTNYIQGLGMLPINPNSIKA